MVRTASTAAACVRRYVLGNVSGVAVEAKQQLKALALETERGSSSSSDCNNSRDEVALGHMKQAVRLAELGKVFFV
jgi:hypothetical protein